MKHLGLSVSVLCGGRKVNEYLTELSGKKTTCFIPSEAGKELGLQLYNQSETALRIRIHVDGQRMPHAKILDPGKSRTMHAFRIDRFTLSPLLFTDIKVTDDDGLVEPNEFSGHEVGLIELCVKRVACFVDSGPAGPATAPSVDFRELGWLHESTKKAGGHCVTRDRGAVTNKKLVPVEVSCLDKRPYMRFLFRYRPLGILQAQGIAPLPTLAEFDHERTTTDVPVAYIGKKRNRTAPENRDSKRARTSSQYQRAGSLSSAQQESIAPAGTGDDVKSEVHQAPNGPVDVNALKTQLSTMQDTVRAMLDNMKVVEQTITAIDTQDARVKRETSPLRIISGSSGDVIDLTDD